MDFSKFYLKTKSLKRKKLYRIWALGGRDQCSSPCFGLLRILKTENLFLPKSIFDYFVKFTYTYIIYIYIYLFIYIYISAKFQIFQNKSKSGASAPDFDLF